jgi:hypothetical protein
VSELEEKLSSRRNWFQVHQHRRSVLTFVFVWLGLTQIGLLSQAEMLGYTLV